MTTLPEGSGPALGRREWLVGVLATLAGCGGGVDSGGTGTGSADPTLSVGTITGFGSIVVNGVRFEESGARVLDDDGRTRPPGDLRLGMRVEVSASAIVSASGIQRASASEIRIRSALSGPVQFIDGAAGRLQVLGQRVDLVAATVVVGGLASLTVGTLVRIHGTLDVAAGRYVATRVESLPSSSALRLRGVVRALDLASQSLEIGALQVDWSGAAPADPAAQLAPGRLVSLELAPEPVGAVWRALSLLPDDSAALPDREGAEVEGRITSLSSVTSFTVDGLQVDASAASFPEGRSGVVLGAKVEVAGRLAAGVLVASQVSVEDEQDDVEPFELHGAIQSVDVPGQQFVVRDVTVRWSAATRFDSSTPQDLAVGREVEVRGRLAPGSESVIEATLVHVER